MDLPAAPRSGPPIFVVGTPRSGTTLLAAMLGAHPLLDCGPETRLLSWFERADRAALLDPGTWPGPATGFVLSLALKETPVHVAFGVTPDEVHASLAAREPSVAALLESLTVTRAAAHGRSRWVEKTPRHLFSLPLIRREWPDAIVIRVVRDPRDVALSLVQVPFGSDSVVVNLTNVTGQERQAAALIARDPHTITVRFEDLVADPHGVLRRVCAVVDVPFDPAMIDRRDGAESIAAPHEWWKRKAAEPLDPSRAGGWRTAMEPPVQRFAALHCRDMLRAHGYPDACDPVRSVAIVPLGDQVAIKHEGLLLALAAQGAVVAEPAPRTPAELARHDDLVFWGNPGQLGLRAGRTALERTAGIARLATLLVARRVTGRGPIWVRRHTNWVERPGDPIERVAANLLRGLARTIKPAALPGLLGLPPADPGSPDE
jgi:hypothetical protein